MPKCTPVAKLCISIPLRQIRPIGKVRNSVPHPDEIHGQLSNGQGQAWQHVFTLFIPRHTCAPVLARSTPPQSAHGQTYLSPILPRVNFFAVLVNQSFIPNVSLLNYLTPSVFFSMRNCLHAASARPPTGSGREGSSSPKKKATLTAPSPGKRRRGGGAAASLLSAQRRRSVCVCARLCCCLVGRTSHLNRVALSVRSMVCTVAF